MTSLTLAYPETTVHEATAAAIIRVLEANDVEPDIVTGPKDVLTDMLKKGEVDFYVSAWLPDEDADMLAPGIIPLGNLFRPAAHCCISAEDTPLTSLDDVAQAGPELSRTIITPASLQQHMENVLQQYGLDTVGFSLKVLPDEAALAELNAALKREELVLMPLFQPCFLFHIGGFRILNDPKNALGGEQDARILIRAETKDEMEQDLLDELDELMLSAKIISAMDYAMRVEGMTADEAAEAWQRGKLLPR